jgi:hypothetical protein
MSFGHSFDVGTQLGLGVPSDKPLPPAMQGMIALRLTTGVSLAEARKNPLMLPERWYERFAWFNQPIEPGTYHLQLPFRGTDGKPAQAQLASFPAHASLAPVTLVVVALLCMRVAGCGDPLNGGWTRAGGPISNELMPIVSWSGGHVNISPGCHPGRP